MTIILSANTSWYLYNFRRGLILAFIEQGYHVVAIAPRDEYSNKLRALGCDYVALSMDNKGSNPLKDLKLIRQYFKLYHNLKPFAVLHFTIKPVIYGAVAARLLAMPYISTITGLGTAFIKQNWLTKVVEYLYRYSQKKAVKLFFQNRDDLALFLKKDLIKQKQTDIVPGSGINLNYFKACPLPQKPVSFLMIARLLKDKGVVEYFRAAQKVKQCYPEVQFYLVGKLVNDNRTALTKAELDEFLKVGVVDYLGEQQDVRPFIEQVQALVLPSYREGMPRTLLEAGAMGRAMIACDVPGCRELVEDGVSGYLCKPKSSDALAQALIKFLELSQQDKKQMAQMAYQKISQAFDEKTVIKGYMNVIKNLSFSASHSTAK